MFYCTGHNFILILNNVARIPLNHVPDFAGIAPNALVLELGCILESSEELKKKRANA